MEEPHKKPRLYFWRCRVIVPLALWLIGTPVFWLLKVRRRRYRPRSGTFLLVANHGDSLDPAYEIRTLGRYIRFVCADYIVRTGWAGRLLAYLATPIIKRRERPREELTGEILANLRAGISVGLHAEGGLSTNGETRYISPNTAKLAKESGCALITFRNTGGYFRTPRWKRHRRLGPLFCQVVREYAPEELAAMSEEEVYEAICRDLYVNCYEEQRKRPCRYRGRDLAESCEIVLYRCPVCRRVGDLHSRGDTLRCGCGFQAAMGEDGFFHGEALPFPDICSWERWQRETVAETAAAAGDGPIFRDEGQLVRRIVDGEPVPVSRDAALFLYRDRLALQWEGGGWEAALSEIKRLEYAKWQSLLVVTEDAYFEIDSRVPRSPTKYVDVWRFLTGRKNL